MSNSDQIVRRQDVVRLKIDGAKTAVNTLRDQQTTRGVSLVCPFPALEVDIPVQFGENADLTTGTIHRIGVEDDPETGLPRLRLSIRSRATRDTVMAAPSDLIMSEARRKTAIPYNKESAVKVDPPKEVPRGGAYFSDSDFGFNGPIGASSVLKADLFTASSADAKNNDPQWVDCADVPMPEDMHERIRTRRRYRAAKHVALAFVVGTMVATGYSLDRSGLIDFTQVKDRIAGLSFGSDTTASRSASADLVALAAAKAPQPAATVSPTGKVAPDETISSVGSAVTTQGIEDVAYAPSPTEGAQLFVESAGAMGLAPDTALNAVADQAGTPAASALPAEEDVTITLPTQWPVEYATAYRVRDPNGVVVDVPGGLVKKEGWLEEAKENKMIRSIKAIQREGGARFVIYVNGELPRYMTTPKPNGVFVRLYYNEEGENTAEVAAR